MLMYSAFLDMMYSAFIVTYLTFDFEFRFLMYYKFQLREVMHLDQNSMEYFLHVKYSSMGLLVSSKLNRL